MCASVFQGPTGFCHRWIGSFAVPARVGALSNNQKPPISKCHHQWSIHVWKIIVSNRQLPPHSQVHHCLGQAIIALAQVKDARFDTYGSWILIPQRSHKTATRIVKQDIRSCGHTKRQPSQCWPNMCLITPRGNGGISSGVIHRFPDKGGLLQLCDRPRCRDQMHHLQSSPDSPHKK